MLALVKLVDENFESNVSHFLAFILQTASLLEQSVDSFVQLPDYHVLVSVLLAQAHH